jgi:hypothetical protein
MGVVAIFLCVVCISAIVLIAEKEISKSKRKWGENF